MEPNRYPIYVISKGRYDNCLTANYFLKDNVPFKLVIEPQEFDDYARKYPKEILQVLPFSNLGLGSYPARNWCWEDSIEQGYKKHWIFDDNIRGCKRLFKSTRIRANCYHAIKFTQDVADNYTNVALAGMNYEMFVTPKTRKIFVKNHHIYSNLLIQNDLTFRWRLRYNEDTDLNLQVLKAGLCTLYTNVFMICKMRTMTMKGGNSDELYVDDGRLKMAKMLEKAHPDVVETKWRFGRPQHVVNWNKYKQPLIKVENPKPINLDDYGKLTVKQNLQSESLKRLINVN